jgi:hypothetical protein
MPNPFSYKANHSLLTHSSARTNVNQGGGPKKAGLVPTAILTRATWLGYKRRGLPRTAVQMMFTANPRVNPTRPVGGKPQNYYGPFDRVV